MSEIRPEMPTTIKVGYYVYRVKFNRDLDAIGITNTERLLIEINPEYPLQILQETLLHECLHAILSDTFVIETKDEEKVVRAISPGLMQVLYDNPKLKAFLFYKAPILTD